MLIPYLLLMVFTAPSTSKKHKMIDHTYQKCCFPYLFSTDLASPSLSQKHKIIDPSQLHFHVFVINSFGRSVHLKQSQQHRHLTTKMSISILVFNVHSKNYSMLNIGCNNNVDTSLLLIYLTLPTISLKYFKTALSTSYPRS